MREPTEWKSAVWWRDRPYLERFEYVHFPKRLEIAKASLDMEMGDNLIITGEAKRGKSTMAACIVDTWLRSANVSARWVPADDYVEWIKDSFNNDGELPMEYSTPYLIKNVKAVYDIVVLDGLGEERQTDFARHELGSLIRKRYDDMRTTIITTTLTPDQIVERYGARVKSAIDTYEVEAVSGRK